MIQIAIDAMGGDLAPAAVLDGVKLVLPELPETVRLILYGDETAIRSGLGERGIADSQVDVVPTTQVIGCDESPTLAIRVKKDSSMVRAIMDTTEGKAQCVVSAGSTGALLTGGTLLIRRLKGVKRPALATAFPTKTGGATLLLDCGANTDCKPEYLVQFAVMGSAYMEQVMGVKNPRIGLLNNGAEEEKGNELTKATYPLLKDSKLHFTGNCEARDVLSGEFDVVVCDGFDGNMVLKSTEGAVSMLMDQLKSGLTASLRAKLGAALAMPALKALKKKLDYTEYGGAPLLGVNAGVIKAHGSSNGKAFRSAILQAMRLVQGNVPERVGEALKEIPGED